MANYQPVTVVTIYVRPRKITRNGKRVDGWQAGFQPKSGVTSEDKQGAIDYQQAVAKRMGARVTEVIEEARD